MNIAIGKFGKSILFNPNSWGAIGGDIDAPTFYENAIINNPQHNFYIVGKSDFNRLSPTEKMRINQHGNVHNVWDGFGTYVKTHGGKTNRSAVAFMDEWMETSGVNIDCGIFFAGLTGTSNVIGKARLMKTPEVLATPLEMLCNYTGPIFSFLNETQIPYALVVTDPRYYPTRAKDLFNHPKVVLSQYDETVKFMARPNYTDEPIEVETKGEYSGVETLFLTGRDRENLVTDSSLDAFFGEEESPERNINFMIVCNEGSPSRYPDLKKYILDHVDDVDIYGKWDPETIGNDSRFKGPKKFNDLQKMLPKVKYTFCIPIKKGWVTAKFWEMAHYGIIPFVHPTYDEQNHIGMPPFLKVKDAKDLFNKIKFLEENPEGYQKLKDSLDELLADKYYDGSYITELTRNTIETLMKKDNNNER